MGQLNRIEAAETAGRTSGTFVGVLSGAEAGTTFIPIPVVGTLIGAFAGGLIGSELGRRIGGVLARGTATLAGAVSLASAQLAANMHDRAYEAHAAPKEEGAVAPAPPEPASTHAPKTK